MAQAGVPIGSINASPEGTAMANVMTFGSIPSWFAIDSATGIRMAITAALLITSVRAMDNRENRAITTSGDEAHFIMVIFAVHAAAPLLSRAYPRVMAPPYMRITPHLTYSSTSFHFIRSRTKRTTTEARAMFA